MRLADTLEVLVRRWLVVVLGLVLTGLAGNYAVDHVGRDNQATGQLVLLLPSDMYGTTTLTNPYLNLQDGLSTVASLVAAQMMAPDTQEQMRAEGLSAEYDVALNPGTGPLLVITATSKDPQEAIATRDAVMSRITQAVAQLQTAFPVPARQTISTRPANTSPGAEVLPGSRLRALVGTLAAGGLLVLVIVFGSDRVLERRRRARASRVPPPESDERPPVSAKTRAPRPRPGARDDVLVG